MRKVLSLVKSRLRERSNQDLVTYRELQVKLAGVPRYQAGFVTPGVGSCITWMRPPCFRHLMLS